VRRRPKSAASRDRAVSSNKALLDDCKVRWRRKKHGDDHAAIRKERMAWYRALPKGDPRGGHKHDNWSDERGSYFASDFAAQVYAAVGI
jgi:adenine-specific DNA-methyltransferase